MKSESDKNRENNIHRINNHLINLSRIYPGDSILKIIYRALDHFSPKTQNATNEQILKALTKAYKYKD
jgi:hypothetical protein